MLTSTINNKTVTVSPNHITISYQNEWAMLERRPNSEGCQGITFSTEVTEGDVAIINNSGIANVVLVNPSGTISFQRKDFFNIQTMIEVVMDIIQRK